MMGVKIQIKRGQGATATPSLAYGELGWNETKQMLWIGDANNANPIIPLGGSGHTLFLGSDYTQTAQGDYTFNGSLRTVTQPSNLNLSVASNQTLVATLKYVQDKFVAGGTAITLAGDVGGTGSTGSTITTTIQGNAVELSMMQQMALNGFIGNDNGVNNNPQHLTVAEAISLLSLNASDPSHIANFDTQVRTSRLDQMATADGNVSLGGNRLVNLGTPVDAGDAATKGYVDTLQYGLDFKQSVKTRSTVNIVNIATTTTLSTADFGNVTSLSQGDRVLVTAQDNLWENGIYTVTAAGGLIRAADADTNGDLSAGAYVYIESGDDAGDAYVLSTTGDIDIGSPSGGDQVWVKFDGAALPSGELLTVQYGGTGRQNLTANSVLVGNGTSPVNFVSGSAGAVLVATASGPLFKQTLDDTALTIDGGTFT